MRKKIYSTQYGSRLYGTQTPASDLDLKHVVLPDLSKLLLGERIQNEFFQTANPEAGKNTAEDVDEEFIPLQIFARDFLLGQTYAIEIAFSTQGSHADQSFYDLSSGERLRDPASIGEHLFTQFSNELKEQFLNSNAKALMHYAVTQANLYSSKGERLNCAKEFFELLATKGVPALTGSKSQSIRIQEAMQDERFAQGARMLAERYPEYFKQTEYDIGGNRMQPCFMMLEKTFPWADSVSHAAAVAQAAVAKFGKRAQQASESNVDWRATMHALRILDEGIEILSEGKLTLPRPPEQVQQLLRVRRGELPLDSVRELLEERLGSLKNLESRSPLPPATPEMTDRFNLWLESWLRRFYDLPARPQPHSAPSKRPGF